MLRPTDALWLATPRELVHVLHDWRRTVVRPRILIADNHLSFLEAVTALLRPHFEVVGVAHNGEELVSETERLSPDVLVVDITMPVMSGIDAVRTLRESGFAARVVFLTIHNEEEFLTACMAEGALGYVWKTFMRAHLIPAINSALDNTRYISPLKFLEWPKD